jgi:hypothetical protein
MEEPELREAVKIGAGPGRGYIIVLLSALLLYAVTCAPGPLWQDSGMTQYRAWYNDIEGNLGLALSHPLFYIILAPARYIQLGEFAYRVNLVSAMFSAVAVANLFLLLRLWLGRTLPAVVGAASLALSHTFWAYAAIPEIYGSYVALMLLELVVLLQYCRTRAAGYIYLLGFINGMAIAVHMMAVIGSVCYAVFILVLLAKRQIRAKQLVVTVLLLLVGALPYEYLIIKNIIQTGAPVEVLGSALFGSRYQADVLNISLSPKIIKENIMWILLNFPTPNIVLFFFGAYGLYKLSPSRAFANVITALVALFFMFAFRYTVVDRYVFFIPFYCFVSVLIGVGFEMFVRRPNRRAISYLVLLCTLLPIPTYIVVPGIAGKLGIQGRARQIPYRDEYRYFLQPWQMDCRGPQKFMDAVFDMVEPNSIVLADSTTVFPLLYGQEVKGKRPDIKIISSLERSEDSPVIKEDNFEQLLARRNIYVVSPVKGYCPKFILERYSFVPAGVIWRVVQTEAH